MLSTLACLFAPQLSTQEFNELKKVDEGSSQNKLVLKYKGKICLAVGNYQGCLKN